MAPTTAALTIIPTVSWSSPSTRERERECVCVCERERERRERDLLLCLQYHMVLYSHFKSIMVSESFLTDNA